MPNFAQVTLVGHIGKDPETKTVGADTVTSFSVATNRKIKDQDTTTWWNCACWGKRGEAIRQYLKKGDPILVVGEPSMRKYQTQDGRDGVSLEVQVRDWSFVGGKDTAQTPSVAPSGDSGAWRPHEPPRSYDEEIPF